MRINSMFSNNRLLEKALDASLLKNETIADNIANVDTPGYKRKDVRFEEFLRNAQNTDSIEPEVVTEYDSLNYRKDGNNVDIDAEMAEMAKNTIRYNVLISRMNGKFRDMRTVMKG